MLARLLPLVLALVVATPSLAQRRIDDFPRGAFDDKGTCDGDRDGDRYRVTDAADSDCDADGGTTKCTLICQDGSWVKPGTGGGGGGPVGFDDVEAGSSTVALTVGSGGSLAPTGTGTITANVVDAVGAAAIVAGSADVTSFTVTTDGTGDDEVVLPAQSISTTEILNATITNNDISASAAIAGTKIVEASAIAAGVVSTGAQSLSGAKTFTSAPTMAGATINNTLVLGGYLDGTSATQFSIPINDLARSATNNFGIRLTGEAAWNEPRLSFYSGELYRALAIQSDRVPADGAGSWLWYMDDADGIAKAQTLSSFLLETEINTFAEWEALLADLSGTAAANTFLEGDGSWQAGTTASTADTIAIRGAQGGLSATSFNSVAGADGTNGLTLPDNTTDCEEPSADEMEFCSIAGEPAIRVNGGDSTMLRTDAPNGIHRTIGNEATWSAILDQSGPEVVPDNLRWFYFDSDNGSDSNTCGPADPCQSPSKMNDLCDLPYTACAIDPGTYSGAGLNAKVTLTPTCATTIAGADIFCNYFVARTRQGTTSTWSDPGPHNAPVIFDTSSGSDTVGSAIIDIGTSADGNYGTVVIEGVQVVIDAISGTDGFSQNGSARARLYRTRCDSSATGTSDQCYTSHNTYSGGMVVSGASGNKTNGNSFVKPVGNSHMMLFGNGEIRATDTVGSTMAVAEIRESASMLLGGLVGRFDDQDGGQTAIVLNFETSATHSGDSITTVRFLNHSADDNGGSDGYAIRFDGGADTVLTYESYQETWFNCDRCLFVPASQTLSGTSDVSISAVGLLADDVENLTVWLNSGWATSADVVITLDGFIYDDQDLTSPFKIDTASTTGYSAFDTSATSWTAINAIDSNAGSAGSQFVSGTAACDPADECDEGLDDTYVVTLPVCLPDWDLGARLCSFELYGRNIGAR